jgi:hypothetical protein
VLDAAAITALATLVTAIAGLVRAFRAPSRRRQR